MTTKALDRLPALVGVVMSCLGVTHPVAGAESQAPVLVAPSAPQADYLVDVWDTDRGLPHSTVTSLAQTPDGYLWVGTQHGGLARFDGVRFVSFHPGNTPELRSIEMRRLLVDAQGTLWVGTVEGAVVSLKDGRFRFERESPETPPAWLEDVVACEEEEVLLSSLSGWLFRGHRKNGSYLWETIPVPDAVQGWSPCLGADGTVWYRTTPSGLGRWNGSGSSPVPEPSGLKHRQINRLMADGDHRIWVGTGRELAMWAGDRFVNRLPTNGEPENVVHDFAFTPDDAMWVRTPGRLRKCKDDRWVVEAIGWPNREGPESAAGRLHADAEGGVWLVNYDDALWHVDAAGRTTRIGPEQGLPRGVVTSWLQDREGNVWIGLADGGLARIRQATFHVVWPEDTTRERAARSVCEDRSGTVWFGTSGDRLLRWRDGHFTSFTPPVSTVVGRDLTVCPDAQGRVWVGTVQNGVLVLDQETFSRPFGPVAVGTVARALYADHEGSMWIGNEFGLYRWRSGELKRFTAEDGFGPAYVVAITEDPGRSLWVGTAVGELRRYWQGSFSTYRPEDALASKPSLLPTMDVEPLEWRGRGTLSGGERFWALHADDEGVIWIGSLGGGLLRFKDGQFTRYTPRVGLPSEHVNQILEDDQAQLWLGTRNGVVRVAKAQLEQFARGEIPMLSCVTYGRFDGLPTVECSGGYQPACWRGHDGRLWFATAKGAVWVRPEAVPFNPMKPPVVIEEVWVDGEPVDDEGRRNSAAVGSSGRVIASAARAPNRLRVRAGRHYFEFKFTALSFTSPDKVRFKWQLDGLERDWVEGGTKRSVSYSFIPPGDYVFRVQACNNDGVWNQEGAALQLVVLPSYWQTSWFRLLAVGTLAALLFGLYRLKVARMRALERLRLRIARDLHDEVGANLGSISLLAQVMEKKPSTEDATLVRDIAGQTVDTLRDIVWFIDPAHERLSDLVARMRETAGALLHEIPFQFESGGDFSSEHLPLDFRRNALPWFKEALHNIVKHARATQVKITVRRRGNAFEVQIHDNGIGFDPRARSSGNGLKNLKRRAREMRGELSIDSQPGQGATLSLRARIT